jgi:hypothetical protein
MFARMGIVKDFFAHGKRGHAVPPFNVGGRAFQEAVGIN